MKVLLFGFDGSEGNPHLPKNHTECSVVYTGTHDTNTAKGWFSDEASAKEKHNVYKALGRRVSAWDVGFELVELALASKSRWCVVPLQDVLGLGSNARMNNPSRPCGNWTWRVTGKQLANCKMAAFGDLTSQNRRA
jgi:4-alpha-glucanotransferase